MEEFVSFAQNGEDVVLWRALRHVQAGSYIDVGANHPTTDSVTRAFYDRGWRGILAEPNPEFATLLREEREGDWIEEAVVSDVPGASTLHAIPGTGLSTIIDETAAQHQSLGFSVVDIDVPAVGLSDLIEKSGLADKPIHFISIDTEGAEASVLRSIDFARHRPWILVVEATAPNSTHQVHAEWEPIVTGAGYIFCLFDGLSRFYVSPEHVELAPLLSYPACVLDHFVRAAEAEAIERAEERVRAAQRESSELRKLNERYRTSTSWRLTAPVRFVGRLLTRSKPA